MNDEPPELTLKELRDMYSPIKDEAATMTIEELRDMLRTTRLIEWYCGVSPPFRHPHYSTCVVKEALFEVQS